MDVLGFGMLAEIPVRVVRVLWSKLTAVGSSMCEGGGLSRCSCVQSLTDDMILRLLLGLFGGPSGF